MLKPLFQPFQTIEKCLFAIETLLDIQFLTSKEQKNWTMLRKVHLEAVHRKLIPSRVSISQRVLVQYPWKECTERGNNVINVNLQKAGFTCTDIKTLPMQSLSVFTIRKCIYLLMPRQITTKYQLCFAVFSNLPRGQTLVNPNTAMQ